MWYGVWLGAGIQPRACLLAARLAPIFTYYAIPGFLNLYLLYLPICSYYSQYYAQNKNIFNYDNCIAKKLKLQYNHSMNYFVWYQMSF